MSDFPYTEEQVKTVGSLLRHSPRDTAEAVGRHTLQLLLDAGITVSFPEPRFRAVPRPGGAWAVVTGLEVTAYFSLLGGHPDPKGAAEEEAARLNREDTP